MRKKLLIVNAVLASVIAGAASVLLVIGADPLQCGVALISSVVYLGLFIYANTPKKRKDVK